MNQWPAGIAYITCPQDIDRDIYIKECFLNNRVSIRMEDGSHHNQVILPTSILNEIEFPLNFKELGSAVAYLTESQHQKPMIIAHYPKADSLGEGRENSFQFTKKYEDKLISIDGDVKKGVLSLNINGGSGISKIYVGVDNDNETGELEVEVSGGIIMKTSGSTGFQNLEEFRSTVGDGGEDNRSVISQTKDKTIVGNRHLIINGQDIEMIHYKGHRIVINEEGIEIDSLDKDIVLRAGDSVIQIDSSGVEIDAKAISLNGSFEVLYNKIPGAPIANVKQIGVSKKVKVG